MNDRNCANCTHRKDGECTRWDCEYEPIVKPKMNDLISILSEIRSQYNCFDPKEEPYYRALSEAIGLISAQKTQLSEEDATKGTTFDYISRQAAIDALCDECPRVQSVCPHYPCREYLKIEELPSVQENMRVNLDIQKIATHKSDFSDLDELPSERSELNEWCTDCKEYDQERHCCPRFNRVIRETVEEIKAEHRWIPVTERVPEEVNKSYWVCTDYGSQVECRWTNVNRFWADHTTDWHWNICDIPQFSSVIAWMPLPEPYKGEK